MTLRKLLTLCLEGLPDITYWQHGDCVWALDILERVRTRLLVRMKRLSK